MLGAEDVRKRTVPFLPIMQQGTVPHLYPTLKFARRRVCAGQRLKPLPVSRFSLVMACLALYIVWALNDLSNSCVKGLVPHPSVGVLGSSRIFPRWSLGSAVKGTECSSRGSHFNSQHPQGSLLLSITPVPGGLTLSHRCTCRQAKHQCA